MHELPIYQVLPVLKQALAEQNNAVLTAAPGAGKTTRVPLALLDEPWMKDKKMVMLEPRRLAARMAARYMASVLGERVGETVGYRVHRDTCVSAATRIEVVTEGVLTRMLQRDPALEHVGLLLFDEFHERSLQTDLGLALALETQTVLREDLRIVVMSATLETDAVAALLDGAPVIHSEGRQFPIVTHYLPQPVQGRIESAVAAVVQQALREQNGDVLVFLPGTGEVRRVERLLQERLKEETAVIRSLYGDLSQQQQDEALAPDRQGRRKIVLATAIAETSLTVEGVQIVVDAGLARSLRFSPRTGMTRLETMPVSRPSADQRRGRAGRLGPGHCYRLWTQAEDARLAARALPEMLSADLASLRLELAAWGVMDVKALRWLDTPPDAAYMQADGLLHQLGAVDEDGRITSHGRAMSDIGAHPRLAHMLLQAGEMNAADEAAVLAALLSERDIFRIGRGVVDADLRERMAFLQNEAQSSNVITCERIDVRQVERLRREVGYWKRTISVGEKHPFDSSLCGLLIAFAYPDRIGRNRGDGRFLLSNGRGAVLDAGQTLAKTPYIVAADLDDSGMDGRIFLAAAVEETQLRRWLTEQIESVLTIAWDERVKAVRAVSREKLGALVLSENAVMLPDGDERVLAVLMDGIRREGLAVLPWTKEARTLQKRLQFMRFWDACWPDRSDEGLLDSLEEWLAPYVSGVRNAEQLGKLRLAEILLNSLKWEEQQQLRQWAPQLLDVPSGRTVAVDYSDPERPVLAVKLQEMFGAVTTPTLADGRAALTLQLLSPAGRPVQVTQDLANFWRNGYFEVKKDLKGRYPKHYWPDDPFAAVPTSRVRPKGQ